MIRIPAVFLARFAVPLALLLMVSLVGTPPAHARSEPVMNVSSSPVPAGLSGTQVEKGIILGGSERGWIISRIDEGHLLGTLKLRRHVAVVDIRWTPSSYSITYKDSQNLKHRDGVIHRNYNKWVRNLDLDIQRALTTISLK